MNDLIQFDAIDKDGPQSFRATLDVPVHDVGRIEVEGVGPVTIEGSATQGDLPGEYIADGTVHFTADFTCSRCIEPYPFANTSTFHVRFRPRPALSGEEEIEITAAEELDVEFYSERTIPLPDLALEQIQLSIPMKTLCSEACLGLCPQCGADRNRENCACDTSMTDERWGVLRGIRDELTRKRES